MPTHRLTHPFPFKSPFLDPLAFLTRARHRVRLLQFSLLPVPSSMPWRPEMKGLLFHLSFGWRASPLPPVLLPHPTSTPPRSPNPASSARPAALLPLTAGDYKTGPFYLAARLHFENAHEVILKSMGSERKEASFCFSLLGLCLPVFIVGEECPTSTPSGDGAIAVG